MALLVASASAQMEQYDSLFRQFGNCMGADFGDTQVCANIERPNAQCCDFVVVQDETITGQFCISDKQREGRFTGTYRDYDYTLWKWECKEPEDIIDPNEKESDFDLDNLSPYSNYLDKNMEWILWVMYLSQEVWAIGLLLVSLPMGLVLLPWF